MLKPRLSEGSGLDRREPSLFDAARDNDISHLWEGIRAGKSLSEPDPRNGFTPLHVAALNGSLEFIRAAASHKTADPWVRDHAQRLAIDHADARKDRETSKLLFHLMYPNNRVPLLDKEQSASSSAITIGSLSNSTVIEPDHDIE